MLLVPDLITFDIFLVSKYVAKVLLRVVKNACSCYDYCYVELIGFVSSFLFCLFVYLFGQICPVCQCETFSHLIILFLFMVGTLGAFTGYRLQVVSVAIPVPPSPPTTFCNM